MYLNVNCYIKNGLLHKKIIRSYVLDYSNDKNYKYNLKKLTKTWFVEDSADDAFDIKKLIINDVDFTDNIERKHGIDSSKHSKYRKYIYYSFKDEDKFKEIVNVKKTISVEIEYLTKVNIDDLTMSYRVYNPCKKFDVVFTYDQSVLDVFCEVFAFKNRETNEQALCKNRIQVTHNNNCINVNYRDWILPGDGIIFVFAIKNN